MFTQNVARRHRPGMVTGDKCESGKCEGDKCEGDKCESRCETGTQVSAKKIRGRFVLPLDEEG